MEKSMSLFFRQPFLPCTDNSLIPAINDYLHSRPGNPDVHREPSLPWTAKAAVKKIDCKINAIFIKYESWKDRFFPLFKICFACNNNFFINSLIVNL